MEKVVRAYGELVEAFKAVEDNLAVFEARMDDLATAVSADQFSGMEKMVKTEKGTGQ